VRVIPADRARDLHNFDCADARRVQTPRPLVHVTFGRRGRQEKPLFPAESGLTERVQERGPCTDPRGTLQQNYAPFTPWPHSMPSVPVPSLSIIQPARPVGRRSSSASPAKTPPHIVSHPLHPAQCRRSRHADTPVRRNPAHHTTHGTWDHIASMGTPDPDTSHDRHARIRQNRAPYSEPDPLAAGRIAPSGPGQHPLRCRPIDPHLWDDLRPSPAPSHRHGSPVSSRVVRHLATVHLLFPLLFGQFPRLFIWRATYELKTTLNASTREHEHDRSYF